ncbi:hypothetical protein OH802_05170 [Nocardioides sp. NBC_00850]|jgi:hypothetical protein|nr:hypothetical protein OH802_05170 [Nocardioides sp. NBC_00850]
MKFARVAALALASAAVIAVSMFGATASAQADTTWPIKPIKVASDTTWP